MIYCTPNEAESISFLSPTHNKNVTLRRTQSAQSEFFGPTIYHSSTISEKKNVLLYVQSQCMPRMCLCQKRG
jgi:hypothetical protein